MAAMRGHACVGGFLGALVLAANQPHRLVSKRLLIRGTSRPAVQMLDLGNRKLRLVLASFLVNQDCVSL